jgi:hypothetical protein
MDLAADQVSFDAGKSMEAKKMGLAETADWFSS